MAIAYWCILLAGLMPIFTVAIAKFGKGYDNRDPRRWLEKQEGYRRRADAAHRNHFEAFPFFAAGVLVAQQLQVVQNSIDMVALIFIASRIIYTFFYLTNRAALRSLAWFVALFSVITLFLLPIWR